MQCVPNVVIQPPASSHGHAVDSCPTPDYGALGQGEIPVVEVLLRAIGVAELDGVALQHAPVVWHRRVPRVIKAAILDDQNSGCQVSVLPTALMGTLTVSILCQAVRHDETG